MSDVADRLRRAADLLEQRTGDVTPGPWHAHVPDDGTWAHVTGDVHIHPGATVTWTYVVDSDGLGGGCANDDDAYWIALMHPGIAQPLAAWLRAEAQSADNADAYIASIGKADDPAMAAKLVERHQHALAVARVLIGEDA